jgi:hypothetical protein
MAFNGNEGAVITLEQGAELTGRYRLDHPDSIKGVFYGRSHIEALLAQNDCEGIRMYFAKEADGSQTIVLVGADANQDDLLGLVIENGTKCPVVCGVANPLNSNTKVGSK